MKLAFIFMLSLNLVFFVWQYAQPNKSSVPADVNEENKKTRYKTITLLHEKEKKVAEKKQPVVKTSGVKKLSSSIQASQEKSIIKKIAKRKVERCYKLGPYNKKQNAEQSLAKIKNYGATANLHTEEKRERFRYWVLIPTDSKQEALKKIKKFKEKEVEDVYLIREGIKKDDISLGIFRARSTAQKRIQQLRGLGFRPIVEKHYKIRNKFWLTVKEKATKPLANTAWEDIIGGINGIKKTDDTC